MSEELPYCKCGCGGRVSKKGNVWINGHNKRISPINDIINIWIEENTNKYLCDCGCGKYIVIKKNHYYVGIPKYIHGHYAYTDEGSKFLFDLQKKYWSITENRSEQSQRKIQIYIDNPNERDEVARRQREYIARTERYVEKASERMTQFYIDNPEAVEKQRENANKQWLTQESRNEHGDLMHQIYVNNPEMNYRNSARGQGQDFDAGEWTGYSVNHDRYTREYKQWRSAVFDRDNYICQQCNNGGRIQAHHIHSWSNYPEQRFDIDNGITLCEECHKAVRGYEDEYIDMFLIMIN